MEIHSRIHSDCRLDLEPSVAYIVKLKVENDGKYLEAELKISQMATYFWIEFFETERDTSQLLWKRMGESLNRSVIEFLPWTKGY